MTPKRKVDPLTQAEADSMCTTLEQLRASETMKVLEDVVRAAGLDSQELFLSCIDDTAEEFSQIIEARTQAINAALDI